MSGYVFDQENDKHIIRHNTEWLHPMLKGIPQYPAYTAIRTLLDKNTPIEQRLEAKKQFMAAQKAAFPVPPQELLEQVIIEKVTYPGLNEGDPEIVGQLIVPKKLAEKKRNPCLLHFFGGGFVMGAPEFETDTAILFALGADCVVFSAGYRTLPEAAYPCQVDDAEAAMNYIVEHAHDLRIDPKNVVGFGLSAGGGLTAMLSIRLRDRGGENQLAGQILYHPGPMSDKLCYPSNRLYIAEIWHPQDEQLLYENLMGPDYNRAAIPWDAAPGDCQDFRGLPPTYIHTGDVDFDRDVHVHYAQGLWGAGIYCDLRVWAGCFHTGAGFAVGTPLYEERNAAFVSAAKYLFSGECAR